MEFVLYLLPHNHKIHSVFACMSNAFNLYGVGNVWY